MDALLPLIFCGIGLLLFLGGIGKIAYLMETRKAQRTIATFGETVTRAIYVVGGVLIFGLGVAGFFVKMK